MNKPEPYHKLRTNKKGGFTEEWGFYTDVVHNKENKMTEIGVGTTAKRYYVYFTCKGCDNKWFIEAPDSVDVEIVGAFKFTCKECDAQTEWLPTYIRLPETMATGNS